MGRHGNVDVQRAFEEYRDPESDKPAKCSKVRCRYCLSIRAKNTTRQLEHLQECAAYLESPDHLESLNNVDLSLTAYQAQNNRQSPQKLLRDQDRHHSPDQAIATTATTQTSPQSQAQPLDMDGAAATAQQNQQQYRNSFLMGQRPNPNLHVHHAVRRGPNKRTRDGLPKSQTSTPTGTPQHAAYDTPASSGHGVMSQFTPSYTHSPHMATPAPPPPPPPITSGPSLTNYLTNRDQDSFTTATQQHFLSHAGAGTLSAEALMTWLGQHAHMSRGRIALIGQLMSKIELPVAANSSNNVMWSVLDLLLGAVNNARREMSYFDITASKYGLHTPFDEVSLVTKSYLDLMASSGGVGSNLLEGLIVLWANEHCFLASWNYAAGISVSQHQSLLQALGSSDPVNAALHQSLMPNWTSAASAKLVEACRAVVDDLANAQTSGNGREQMARCETLWRQVLWLWERTWPAVSVESDEGHDDEGEEEEEAVDEAASTVEGHANNDGVKAASGGGGGETISTPARANEPAYVDADVHDDDDDDDDGNDNDHGGA